MKKILVIGGAYQGKHEWVRNTFPEYMPAKFQEIEEGKVPLPACFENFHLWMRQMLEENGDYGRVLSWFKNADSWIVISDEVGSGVVPMLREERRFREETGRMLTELAKEADEVYRIFCGIPGKIKGN